MVIQAFDQSMRSTGWALSGDNELQLVGLITTKPSSLKGVKSMIFQRNHIRALIEQHTPDMVIFEDTHYRRSVKTAKLLAGLLYMLLAMCEDMGQPYELITSMEVSKHLHLAFGTGRDKKGNRTIDFAREIMFGSIDGTDDPDPQADIASAVIILNAAHVKLGQPRLAPAMKQGLLL